MKTDLHIHTSASDGTWSPEALIQNVIDAGIKIFSVTDHETVENIAAVSDLTIDTNLTFIRGVEINAYSEGQTFHILGYNIDTEDEGLNHVLLKNRAFFERQNKKSIAMLMEMGHPVSPHEYDQYQNNPDRGGWKALNYTIDQGLCQTYKEFFNLFDGKKDFFKMNVDIKPEAAISCIRQAGGIPVLAHPGSGLYGNDFKKTVSSVLEIGIEGLECYHPENSTEVTEYCLEICKKHNLYITGGSDCHGEFVKGRRLGKPDIDLSRLKIWNLEMIQ
jgi:predicted metal-dependent phosphoesterase TrpH